MCGVREWCVWSERESGVCGVGERVLCVAGGGGSSAHELIM